LQDGPCRDRQHQRERGTCQLPAQPVLAADPVGRHGGLAAHSSALPCSTSVISCLACCGVCWVTSLGEWNARCSAELMSLQYGVGGRGVASSIDSRIWSAIG